MLGVRTLSPHPKGDDYEPLKTDLFRRNPAGITLNPINRVCTKFSRTTLRLPCDDRRTYPLGAVATSRRPLNEGRYDPRSDRHGILLVPLGKDLGKRRHPRVITDVLLRGRLDFFRLQRGYFCVRQAKKTKYTANRGISVGHEILIAPFMHVV